MNDQEIIAVKALMSNAEDFDRIAHEALDGWKKSIEFQKKWNLIWSVDAMLALVAGILEGILLTKYLV